MVFSSASFLIFFLPCLLVLYFLVPRRCRYLRNLILLAFSLAFYACGGPKFLLLMLLSIVINYVGGLLAGPAHRAGTRRLGMTLAVVLGLALLGWFKYAGFFGEMLHALLPVVPVPQVTLPIGISFFTFQGLSYVIDVYRGDTPPNRSIAQVALYISFFPQLIAGPIVRYTDVAEDMNARCESLDDAAEGAARFIFGLGKKCVLSNALAELADSAFACPEGELSTALAWLGIIAYALYIYYDFSGYSDMAIGLGKLFGFRLPENFNYPYISASVTEFWRRWHMTLSGWFRDYLYIPLGGSRRSTARNILNLLIVWACTGLWHGADWNFLIWGLWYALFLICERYVWHGAFERLPKAVRHVLTMFVVLMGWVWFRAAGPGEALGYFGALFSGPLWSDEAGYWLAELWPELLLGCVLAAPVYPELKKRLGLWRYALALVVFGLAVSSLLASGFNPFIYFRF